MEKTKVWLMRCGRPLEAARWEFLFEQGSKESVIRYLQAFQNPDGVLGMELNQTFGCQIHHRLLPLLPAGFSWKLMRCPVMKQCKA